MTIILPTHREIPKHNNKVIQISSSIFQEKREALYRTPKKFMRIGKQIEDLFVNTKDWTEYPITPKKMERYILIPSSVI